LYRCRALPSFWHDEVPEVPHSGDRKRQLSSSAFFPPPAVGRRFSSLDGRRKRRSGRTQFDFFNELFFPLFFWSVEVCGEIGERVCVCLNLYRLC
jgi:hypothetical protein